MLNSIHHPERLNKGRHRCQAATWEMQTYTWDKGGGLGRAVTC